MNNFYLITEKVFYRPFLLLPSFLTGSDCGYLNLLHIHSYMIVYFVKIFYCLLLC